MINIILILTMCLLGLISSESLMGGDTTIRILLFNFICGAICMNVAYGIFRLKGVFKLRTDLIDAALLLYCIWCTVSFAHTKNNPLEGGEVFRFLLLFVLYAYIKNIVRRTDRIMGLHSSHVIILIFLIAGLSQAIVGILQYFGLDFYHSDYSFIIHGSFNNPDSFAGFMSLIIPFAIQYIWPNNYKLPHDNILQWISLVTFPLLVIMISVSMIRGAWFACSVSAILIFMSNSRVICFLKTKVRSMTSAIPLFIVILFIVYFTGTFVYSLKPDSANGRLFIWKISFNVISDHLITGVGQGRFATEYAKYQANYFSSGTGTEYEKLIAGYIHNAHNEYIHILSETGMIGLCLYTLVLVLTIYHYRRMKDRDNRTIAAISSLLSYCIFSVTSTPSKVLPLHVFFFLILAIISSFPNTVRHIAFDVRKHYGYSIAIILMIVGFSISTLSVVDYERFELWENARRASLDYDYEEAEIIYKELMPWFKENGRFLFMYGAVLFVEQKYDESEYLLKCAQNNSSDPQLLFMLGSIKERQKLYPEAEHYYRHASSFIPHLFYPRYRLVKVLTEKGEHKKALSLAREIIQQPVKIPSNTVEMIKNEMKEFVHSVPADIE